MSDHEDTCYHCGAPATLLCDFVLGMEKYATVPAHTVDGRHYPALDVTSPENGSRVFKCDRPMCEACSTYKGMTFCDGEAGGVETTDYCRDHADGDDTWAPVVTEEQADALRNRMNLRAFEEAP